MNPKVNGYIGRAKWREEMQELRRILLGCPLTEELKWGKACYTFQDSNVVLLVGFKEHCALLFAKGALLKDPKDILIQPTENSQATRQLRFTNVRDIAKMEPTLKAYIKEAIAVQKAGLDVVYKKSSDLVYPEEFQSKLEANPALKKAFATLTPGRQRGYHLYFTAAKQAKTRETRVEKCMKLILKGKGLNDE